MLFRSEVQCTLMDLRLHPESQSKTKAKEITFIDLRGKYKSHQEIMEFIKQMDGQVWSEGIPALEAFSHARSSLRSSNKLILGSTPCSIAQFRQLLYIVNPTELYLLTLPVQMDTFEPLINYFAGIIKYALQNKEGWIPYRTIEEKCAQPPATIKTIFKYFQATGVIDILDETMDGIQITTPGIEKKGEMIVIRKEIEAHLAETRSRRCYFSNIPLEILTKAILEK